MFTWNIACLGFPIIDTPVFNGNARRVSLLWSVGEVQRLLLGDNLQTGVLLQNTFRRPMIIGRHTIGDLIKQPVTFISTSFPSREVFVVEIIEV